MRDSCFSTLPEIARKAGQERKTTSIGIPEMQGGENCDAATVEGDTQTNCTAGKLSDDSRLLSMIILYTICPKNGRDKTGVFGGDSIKFCKSAAVKHFADVLLIAVPQLIRDSSPRIALYVLLLKQSSINVVRYALDLTLCPVAELNELLICLISLSESTISSTGADSLSFGVPPPDPPAAYAGVILSALVRSISILSVSDAILLSMPVAISRYSFTVISIHRPIPCSQRSHTYSAASDQYS